MKEQCSILQKEISQFKKKKAEHNRTNGFEEMVEIFAELKMEG